MVTEPTCCRYGLFGWDKLHIHTQSCKSFWISYITIQTSNDFAIQVVVYGIIIYLFSNQHLY